MSQASLEKLTPPSVPLPPMPTLDRGEPPEPPYAVEIPERNTSIFQNTQKVINSAKAEEKAAVEVRVASLWRHLAATCIDAAMLSIIGASIYNTYLWLHAPENLTLVHSTGILDSYRAAALTWALGTMLVLGAGYHSFCALKNGQTLGRMLMGIVLIPESGNGLAPLKALQRTLLALLSLFCLGAGYFWAIVDKKSRTWHDIANGTVTVYRRVSIKS